METVAGVIFDLDGTLLDTIGDLADAMNTALAERSFPPRTVDECKQFVGDGVEAFLRRALPEDACSDELVAAMDPRYRERYGAGWHVKTRPYPGVVELLAGLHAAGLPLAVLSNKPDAMTKQTVAHFLPDVPFAVVQGARPDVPLKPDPTSALDVASKMNAEPGQICYVGDTATDMQTAVGAGMLPVGVLWGFRDVDELRASGARHILSHPREIADIITGAG